MQPVDLLIHARWVIPMDRQDAVLQQHSLAIEAGRIVAVLPTVQATQQYAAKQIKTLGSHALIPGLINCHGHAAMTLFRGMADDLPLDTWLNEHIWPAEKRWVNEHFVQQGTQLAIAEMLRSGTTCFSDHYFYPEGAAQIVEQTGIRAQLCCPILDFPTPWAQSAQQYLQQSLALCQRYRQHSHIRIALGPHAPYTVSDELLRSVLQLAQQHSLRIQMHVHETQAEVDQAIATDQQRPLRRLKQLGLLGRHFQAVHMTALNDDDLQDLCDTQTPIVHCPESNLKLASGFCPVDRLLQRGITLALGTDGAASNNDLDMWGEMRTASLLAKAVAGNAQALPAYQTLAMATVNGAAVLGLDEQLGRLLPGMQADVVAVDLGSIESLPLYDPISQLVYATTRNQVSDVWVAGRHLLASGKLTTIDIEAVQAQAQSWLQRIRGQDQAAQQEGQS